MNFKNELKRILTLYNRLNEVNSAYTHEYRILVKSFSDNISIETTQPFLRELKEKFAHLPIEIKEIGGKVFLNAKTIKKLQKLNNYEKIQ